MLRDAGCPFSMYGVRPAATISGTRSRNAFVNAQTALAVPTFTCSITACG